MNFRNDHGTGMVPVGQPDISPGEFCRA
jgi:hypothetical protein